MKFEKLIIETTYSCDLCNRTNLSNDASSDDVRYTCKICGKDLCQVCSFRLHLVCGIDVVYCNDCFKKGSDYLDKIFKTQEELLSEWHDKARSDLL